MIIVTKIITLIFTTNLSKIVIKRMGPNSAFNDKGELKAFMDVDRGFHSWGNGAGVALA